MSGRKSEAIFSRLNGLLTQRDFPRLVEVSREVLKGNKQHHFAHKTLTTALLELGRVKQAITALQLAVRKFPSDAELHNNLGIAYSLNLQWPSAMRSFDQALKLDSKNALTHKNLGLAYYRMHRWFDALAPLIRAIELYDGEFVEAVGLLALALEQANKLEEAKECIEELVADDPADRHYLAMLLSVSFKLCDWRNSNDFLVRLKANIFDPQCPGEMCNPFSLFSLPGFSSSDIKRATMQFVRQNLPSGLLEPSGSEASTVVLRSQKALVDGVQKHPLRIAYLSADLRNHPVGLVIPEIIERHDRKEVFVIGYALSTDDGSEIRKRLQAAFDKFVVVDSKDHLAIAEQMHTDRIDILVDLHGWTALGRPEVLALRPAPVIVNWLGYAGTLGHPRLADYIVGDPVVTPAENAEDFTEVIAQLPNCYLPYDTTRPVSEAPTRTSAGLPEKAFVFCSFNNVYKINPEVFDLWCRILAACPGSVLWLSIRRESAKLNISREAELRGIAAERIVFAPSVDGHADHLARISIADLALDPFPYNSHSTGLDTLWAGVPMVSLRGGTFAGRVGVSILEAANIPQLIASSAEEYFQIATRLFQQPDELKACRRILVDGRAEKNLAVFDMAGFTLDLEGLYRQMWRNHLVGRHQPIWAERAAVSDHNVLPLKDEAR
jgi:protein O-GlcNAc transferase